MLNQFQQNQRPCYSIRAGALIPGAWGKSGPTKRHRSSLSSRCKVALGLGTGTVADKETGSVGDKIMEGFHAVVIIRETPYTICEPALASSRYFKRPAHLYSFLDHVIVTLTSPFCAI